MKQQIKIFLSGALVVVPLAVTLYVLFAVAAWLDAMAESFVRMFHGDFRLPFHGLGVVLLLAMVYLIGLLTHMWLFRGLFSRIEKAVLRIPGAKIIYESVRDLMKLFGGQAGKMGRVVEYRPEGSDITMLGIMTNENPSEVTGGEKKVAVYLPLSLMIGGPTVYTSRDNLKELDMPVDKALKIAGTAHIGTEEQAAAPATPKA
ncbi:MAG: DUF502 domain-containing protein [Planctomycetes bacterium]|nr:DUF502 domain-containing protein [Planctomycetota bacterium]